MGLPYYPSPRVESVINEPGHYSGWFEAFCPGIGPSGITPVLDWTIISCRQDPIHGSHGGCSNCVMSLIELQYIGPDIEPPIENNNIWWYLLILILILILLMMRD